MKLDEVLEKAGEIRDHYIAVGESGGPNHSVTCIVLDSLTSRLKLAVEAMRELEVNTRSKKEGEREWTADAEMSAGALFEALRKIEEGS